MDRLMRPGSFGHSVQTIISPPNRWRLVKSVLFFGIACGILGATIGSAFQALTGARLAAIIGGVPLAIIGSLALGWYGFLFGSVNRLRFREMLGLVLGLLVGGLVGSVCGLIVLTLPWSLVGALIGGILGSSLTAQHRPSLRPFLGTVLGICGGILVLAFQRDQDHPRVGAIKPSEPPTSFFRKRPKYDRRRSSRPAPRVRCPALFLRDFTRSKDECRSSGQKSLAGNDHRLGDGRGNMEDTEDERKPRRRFA